MPSLRVLKNGTNFMFRGNAKSDGPNDELIGVLEIPADLFPLMRDPETGPQALNFYSQAFGGVEGLADVLDMVESEPRRRLLGIVVAAGEVARKAHGSTEFTLAPEPTDTTAG